MQCPIHAAAHQAAGSRVFRPPQQPVMEAHQTAPHVEQFLQVVQRLRALLEAVEVDMSAGDMAQVALVAVDFHILADFNGNREKGVLGAPINSFMGVEYCTGPLFRDALL